MKAYLLIFICLGLASCNQKKESAPEAAIKEVVNCADADAEEVGIVGGKVLSENSRVGKGIVFILQSLIGADGKIKTQSVCTGTLLDSKVVLTAAHCADGGFEEKIKSDTVEIAVSTKAQPLCDRASFETSMIKASAVKIHKDWDSKEIENDIAMILLESSVGSEKNPFLISTSFLSPLENKVFAAGYGRTYDFDGPDSIPVLRFVQMQPMSKTSMDRIVQQRNEYKKMTPAEMDSFKRKIDEASLYKEDEQVMVYDQTLEQGICSGDSGGPIIVVRDSKSFVIGVNSYVAGFKGKASCMGVSATTSVFAYQAWIVEKYRELMNLSESAAVPFLK